MARLISYLSFIFVLIILLIKDNKLVSAFNMDTVNYIRHDGQQQTMFGFSVTLHQEYSKTWAIVGAPKTDTSGIQRGVYNAGAVFKCDITADNACILIPFDTTGNQLNDNYEQVETKSDQWFGATVTSGGVNGPLLACAPRYVYHTAQPKRVERIEPVGNCFLAKNNFREFTQFSPCRTMFWGYHRQGSCQAGFSAAVSKKGDRMFIGAPGSWYWQGQSYSINTDDVFPYKPPKYGKFGDEGQLYSSSFTNPRNRVYETKESSVVEDDSYLGYSSVAGDFNGDGIEGVAVGMPRGDNLLGKVVVMSWNMSMQFNATGEQIGGYFGYSLCAADVDGDTYMDLIVGAPMFTSKKDAHAKKYDVGRVYIFYQKENNKYSKIEVLDGTKSKGRFGLSLASLGDVDADGYQDFVVGAPYDGPKERGAVYIYRGSAEGVRRTYSQVIYAESVSENRFREISTFGFSVGSGGIDLDGNLYPDMVVGAYNSDNAFIFKARPVVVVKHASTRFINENKLIALSSKTNECKVKKPNSRNDITTVCTVVETCFQYNGVNVPEEIYFIVMLSVDTKSRISRLLFLKNDLNKINVTMRLPKNIRTCTRENVYVIQNIRDKLTPIDVEMNYTLYSAPLQTHQPDYVRPRRQILGPALNIDHELTHKDTINIQKNCGANNICIPDLDLKVRTVEKYDYGQQEKLEIEVFVTNKGDDAYEAEFKMHLPIDMNYQNVDPKESHALCTSFNSTVTCDIGNPLEKNKMSNFIIILQQSNKRGIGSSYVFSMGVNSTNPEKSTSLENNILTKKILIHVQSNTTMDGISKHPSFHYNSINYKSYAEATHEEELGPEVVNVHGIINNGPSIIEEADFYVLIPNETLDGEPLMYLLNEPEVLGDITCEPSKFINFKNVELDSNAKNRSYLVKRELEGGSISGGINTISSGGSGGGSSTATGSGSSTISGGSETTKVTGSGGSSSTSTVVTRTNQTTTWHTDQNGGETHTVELTEEQKRLLKANEDLPSKGDGSYDRDIRIRLEKHGEITGPASAGYNESYFTHTINLPLVKHYKNTTIIDSDGNRRTIESSTEYYGTINHGGLNRGSDSGYGTNNRQTVNHNRGHNENYRDVVHEVNQHLRNQDVQTGGTSEDHRHLNIQNGNNAFRTTVFGADSEIGLEKDLGGIGLNRGDPDDEIRTGAFITTHNNNNNNNNNRNVNHNVNHNINYNNNNNQLSGGGSRVAGGGGSRTLSTNRSSYTGGQGHGNSQSAGNAHYLNSRRLHNSPTQYPGAESISIATEHYYDTATVNHQRGANLEPIDNKLRYYDRFRRDVAALSQDEILENKLKCNTTNCAVLKCTVKSLKINKGAWIALRMRFVAKTMENISGGSPLTMSTMAVSHITKLPYVGKPSELLISSEEVFVTAIPEPKPKPDVVPMWVVVLSACAGILILLLIVFLLYLCGFFARKRPSHQSSERQPLNRNGNYHGDEHL